MDGESNEEDPRNRNKHFLPRNALEIDLAREKVPRGAVAKPGVVTVNKLFSSVRRAR